MRPLLLLTALASLAACSRADVDEGAMAVPTPQGEVERVDRIQYLSNAASAVLAVEEAYHHQQDATHALNEGTRLIELAYGSASSGKATVEAGWERKAREALDEIRGGIDKKNAAQVDDGLQKIKLYLDQAQQAASIEY